MQDCQGRLACVSLREAIHFRKVLMNMQYIVENGKLFAQAYGGDSYGQQLYSDCEQTPEGCIPVTQTTTTAPNTGFLGLTPDAAVASLSGALLVAIAVAGAIYVIVARRRADKKKDEK